MARSTRKGKAPGPGGRKQRPQVRRRFCGKTETFRDVERLLWDNVWTFIRRYGDRYGTKDDLFAMLCFTFVRAYDQYDPACGAAFSSYLQTKVYFALRSHLRDFHSLREAFGRAGNELPELPEPEAPGRWRRLLAELSGDARAVVALVVDTPPGLARIMSDEVGDSPFGVRLILRSYLRGAGWSGSRINKSFAEIMEAVR